MVTLIRFGSAQYQVSENGTITPDKLECQLRGKTISDLQNAMNNGDYNANIHTQHNPNGEVRANIDLDYLDL